VPITNTYQFQIDQPGIGTLPIVLNKTSVLISLTLFKQHSLHNNTMCTSYTLFPASMHKTRSERPIAKRKRGSSPEKASEIKKCNEYPPAEPVDGERPMWKAELKCKTRNHIARCHGTFLLDTGCTGAILSEEFVKKEKIPVERRNSPIKMLDPQGDLMKGACEYITAQPELVMGKHEESICRKVDSLAKGISRYLPTSLVGKHNPDIHWQTNHIQFWCEHCKKH
jgi:hypothetical protein